MNQVTVLIGLVASADRRTLNAMLSDADTALYDAEQVRRDRFSSHTDLSAVQ